MPLMPWPVQMTGMDTQLASVKFQALIYKMAWYLNIFHMHSLFFLLVYVPTKNYQVSSNGLELWPAQDFGIRGDNNGESESTLEHNIPTGPYLCLY